MNSKREKMNKIKQMNKKKDKIIIMYYVLMKRKEK